MSNWVCPCNGCKKAQKVIIDQIIEEYRRCPNIVESEDKLFCYTWWRHDDCERLRVLLYNITKKDLYTLPEITQSVAGAIDKMINDPNTAKVLDALGSDYDENGIPYWEKYAERLKNMENNGI